MTLNKKLRGKKSNNGRDVGGAKKEIYFYSLRQRVTQTFRPYPGASVCCGGPKAGTTKGIKLARDPISTTKIGGT